MRILTFDIEEWFHILDNQSTKTEREWVNYESRIHANMDRIFAILEDSGARATFFCLGWIAKKYPDVIKRIDDLGYEIGTHSNLHQLAYDMSQEEFEEDLKTSVLLLEDITGKKVKSYRAPGFSIKESNLWALESLSKAGIEYDCSIFPASRAHGGISGFEEDKPCIIDYKGISIKEFPINTAQFLSKKMIFSGGGYFRLFPYAWIRRASAKQDYIMTYFHPRDFDPDQPMIDGLSLVRKFKSYYGIKNCGNKLKKWLGEYEFIDLRTATNKIDWAKVNVVKYN
ncbi:polysaccharide deacetylase family protein [Flagellimonas sp. 2504JD4-2]